MTVRLRTCSTRTSPPHPQIWGTVLVIVAVGGLAAAAKRLGRPMQGIDWEKKFERMPDNAPPKWMFNNIKAIRLNTDRILELLEQQRPDSAAPGESLA